MLSRKCFCCHSCLPEGWRTQLRVRVSYSRDLRAKKEASIPERTHSGLHKNLPQRLYMISSVGYMSLISKELLIKIYEVGGSFMRQSGCSSHQNKDQVDCLFFFFLKRISSHDSLEPSVKEVKITMQMILKTSYEAGLLSVCI